MNMENDIKRLPDSELEVMQVIWECEAPVMRSEIENRMKEIHEIAQTTLLTHLTRLAEKGFLKIEKTGRSSTYTPLISEHEYKKVQSRRFIDQMFRGNMSAFASALCDSGISQDDLNELKEMLENKTI